MGMGKVVGYALGLGVAVLGLGRIRGRKAKGGSADGSTPEARGDGEPALGGAGSKDTGKAAMGATKGTAAKAKARPEVRPAPPTAEAPAVRPAAAASDRDPVPTAKLDLGPAAGQKERPVEHIPWSYGQDRVTAAAVDPDKLYACWEVTDQAIDVARGKLGPGGADAWLSLRVYDTSGLLFDGTNAHSYFDHRVDRADRQWFFDIGKPSSTAFVDIGMKSSEGYFAQIARSGRVDFPRKESAAWVEPEWTTVVVETGEARHAGTGTPRPATGPGLPAPHGPPPGGPGPGGPGGEGGPPGPFTPIPLWVLREEGEARELLLRELFRGGYERVEWHQVIGEGWFEYEGRLEWQGPAQLTTWEAGPFPYPVEVERPTREEWQGRSFAYKLGDVTHVVFGPWAVTIRNTGGQVSRAVLSRWQIYRSWVAQGGREVVSTQTGGAKVGALGASKLGGSEWVALGASERLWLAASEVRLGGGSEVWRLGASELRLRGASEQLLAGASERRLMGASERMRAAGSEVRLAGGSEQRLGGASEWAGGAGSERRLGGASERMAQGASELRLGGASERRLGGSEGRLGGSEGRLAAGPAKPEARPAGRSAYPKVEE